MLPDDVFAHAYPDPTDPPVQKVIENLAQLSNHIILRKNNSLLVKEIDAEKRLAAASVGMGFGAVQMPMHMFNMNFGAPPSMQHGRMQAPHDGIPIPDMRGFPSQQAMVPSADQPAHARAEPWWYPGNGSAGKGVRRHSPGAEEGFPWQVSVAPGSRAWPLEGFTRGPLVRTHFHAHAFLARAFAGALVISLRAFSWTRGGG